MAMNKVRRTSNINNIVTYDSLGNVTLPASLTIKGLTSAGFVKTDANGLLSVDITAYQPLLPSQAGNAGKFLTTNGSVVSWGTVSTINIYEYDGTLTGNRTVTMGANNLTFLKTIALATNAEGIDIKNNTVSTVLNNSYSPSLTFSSFGWGGTNANTLSRIRNYLMPTSGSPWNLPTLRWDGLNTNGDWTDLMTLKSYAFGGGEPNGGLFVGNSLWGGININVTKHQIDIGGVFSQLVVSHVGGYGIKLRGHNQFIQLDSAGISFNNTTNEIGRFYPSTGNLLIQTGGTFADAGYKLDVNGTARVSGAIGIETSSSSVPFLTHKYSNSQTFSLTRDGNYGTLIGSWDGATSTRCLTLLNNSVSVGSDGTILSSAVLQANSTTKGFLPPRMTAVQRTAISTPATGLLAYNTDSTEGLYLKVSSAWKRLVTSDEVTTTTRTTETFIATASQTVFITTATLTAGYFDVYLNGVRINTNSYASTANSITLDTAARAGDIVDIIGYSVVNFAPVTASAITLFNYYNFT